MNRPIHEPFSSHEKPGISEGLQAIVALAVCSALVWVVLAATFGLFDGVLEKLFTRLGVL